MARRLSGVLSSLELVERATLFEMRSCTLISTLACR
jgi:hypothetical protein